MTANASASASPFHPSMIRLRMPSIRYETGLTFAAQRNQSASIRLRGKFIDEMSRKTNNTGKSPWTASPEPVRSAMNRPAPPKAIAIATARRSSIAIPAAPDSRCTPTA